MNLSENAESSKAWAIEINQKGHGLALDFVLVTCLVHRRIKDQEDQEDHSYSTHSTQNIFRVFFHFLSF